MVIAIAHQKGGVGKSTITTNLASALYEFKEIILVDLDSQNSTKLWTNLREKTEHKKFKCHCVKNIEEFNKVIKENENKIILVDSGGFDSVINRYSLTQADLIITPASASQLDVFGLEKFQKVLKQASESLKRKFKTYVVINNTSSQIKKDKEALRSYCNSKKEFEIFKTTLHTRVDFRRAYAQGLGVVEYDHKSLASAEMKGFAEEVKEIIKNH